jgi:DNA segregation ATPase FtsK/SpoIIIE, S-DNA-T family
LPQASEKKPETLPLLASHVGRGLREGALFVVASIAIFLLLALFSYHPADPGWSRTAGHAGIVNLGGRAGAWFADVTFYLFGVMAYLFPLMVAWGGWVISRRHQLHGDLAGVMLVVRGSGFIVTLVTGAAIGYLHFGSLVTLLPATSGGILGHEVGEALVDAFNRQGATLFLFALFFTGTTLFTGISWLDVADRLGRYTLWFIGAVGEWTLRGWQWLADRLWPAPQEIAQEASEPPSPPDESSSRPERKPARPRPAPPATVIAPAAPMADVVRSAPQISFTARDALDDLEPDERDSLIPTANGDLLLTSTPPMTANPASRTQPAEAVAPPWHEKEEDEGDLLPSLSLLDPIQPPKFAVTAESMEELSRLLEVKLAEFGVDVTVVAVHPGPVITRMELQPAPGVKVNQITNLAKDIARSLSTKSVRVVEVIPGKTTVGLEIPNEKRELIYFAETMQSAAFEQAKSPLTLALGKDIGGAPVVADLARMPHLLVAGTTGSGKSVGINAMILSLLYNATPREVRLIMVDPKMLELSIYEGIPHLLAPVVTDMKDAANALRWCVAEMERRYKLMAALGVRNIASCNTKVREAIAIDEPIPDPTFKPLVPDADLPIPRLEPLPYIVVVIDELADLMMVVGKKVEELIARLAQKARAAGIHLILATQRPSVDVITGLIKANIPTRIAFQVSSKIDSRTILDQMGAESLLGNGDMLYLPPGQGLPVRVHGAFVSDNEVHRVVDDLKRHGSPDYIDEILNGPEEGGGPPLFPGDPMADMSSDGESDPLYDEAVAFVLESRRASVSGVQRRLKIGYNRAARLVEQMERSGLVGAIQPNGSRDLLVPHSAKE